MASDEKEQAIQDFLGDHPRATEWQAMRRALSERLLALRQTRRQEAEAGAEEARLRTLDTQIAALDKQVMALKTEEAVSQFVEDSIKVTLAKSLPGEEEE